jgi:hypothetical protein
MEKLALMAAKHHLSPYQYKLFMTGDEIKDLVSDSVDRLTGHTVYRPGYSVTVHEQTMDDLWEEKKTTTLKNTLAKEGVQRHVTIVPNRDGTFTMGQGHHRVQASSDLAKEGKELYVPVMYDQDWNYTGMQNDEYEQRYPQAREEKF